jgi:hypothetical protein
MSEKMSENPMTGREQVTANKFGPSMFMFSIDFRSAKVQFPVC